MQSFIWGKWIWTLLLVSSVLLGVPGCDDLTGGKGDDELPAGIPNPRTLDNATGALALYRQAVCSFQQCTNGGDVAKIASIVGGLFGDELKSNRLGLTVPVLGDSYLTEFPIDSRQVASEDYALGLSQSIYSGLHIVRRDAGLAAAALRKHGREMSPALRGHMNVIEGYAEILLADLYCSGVPLSTVDYELDYTYRLGSTTEAVYEHAIVLFDSALVISADSTRILNLARVGKARALLNLGRFADAANIAHDVPAGFAYQFKLDWRIGSAGGFSTSRLTVSDREGGTGFPYRSSRDPRTIAVRYGTNLSTRDTLWFPEKYGTQTSISTFTLGDAVEARLIEAEAALHKGEIATWLDFLNDLRTDGTFTVRPNAINPAQIDTLWNAGSGGVAGLAPQRDPGVALAEPAKTDARVDLVFAERAAWMFLTGHRQGDLRRLVRMASRGGYDRAADRVYPTGSYAGGPLLSQYGTDVNLLIPEAEFRNPTFTGCFDRGA